jgi:hypothetical protein
MRTVYRETRSRRFDAVHQASDLRVRHAPADGAARARFVACGGAAVPRLRVGTPPREAPNA